MKKAIIDQILLILFLFVALVGIGATISDNMKARDKYYNLKKITDNAVLTLAKYYVNVEQNTDSAENIYDNMLSQTNLGNEISSSIVYTWDFISEPNTVTANISNYEESTFWFKLFGLNSFSLDVQSIATITTIDSGEPTSSYSAGIAPFAINDSNFAIGDALGFNYSLTAGWQYSDKDTFYPILTNSDCDCNFILSNKFDFSDLGFDVDNCNSSSSGCTTHGESEFRDYARELDNIYNSGQSIDFEDGKTDSPISLIGTYLGNTTSSWGTQINHLSSGIYDIIGNSGQNLPIEMDFITLDTGGIANGIVRLKITGYDMETTTSPGNRYIQLITEVVSAKTEEIKLVE